MASKKLPTYFVEFDSAQEQINYISMVHDPAIEINWVAFNNNVTEYIFKQIEDQQKVAGPLMIPNLPIYRNDVSNPPKPTDLGEYYLVFTPEVIQKMADKFNKDSRNQYVNLEHQPDSKIPGAFVSENWVIEDTKADKSNKYGFKLPIGTWFGIVKIDNKAFWNTFIKEGKIQGFSIEGMLGVTIKKMNKMNTENLAANITELKLKDGTSIFLGITSTDGDVTLGIDAYSDAAGTTPCPDGDYTSDASVITVLGGKVQGIETPKEEAAEPADATPVANATAELADAATPVAPTPTGTPAPAAKTTPETPVADSASTIKDIQGQLAVLTDRVTALEDALNSAVTDNTAMAAKLETLSKAPGAESITKTKLAKETLGSKRTSFDEQLERINRIKSKI